MQFKNTAILFAAIAANSVSVGALPTAASDVSFRGLRALDVNFLARSYEVERSPRAIRALSAAISFARRTDEDISSTTNATLPPLDYAYDALEPYISKEIMTLHHDKHHQAYITALNNAEASYAKASTIQEQISLQQAIKFNGGGHINHSQFWKILAPSPEKGGSGGQIKDGEFKCAVEETFGGIDNLKKEFNTATAAIQGSGWGWLGVNTKTNRLEITSTANQDPLLTHIPIIGVDVWEHAFYLQYKNVKADYLAAIWNVINFDEAEKRYSEAVATKA